MCIIYIYTECVCYLMRICQAYTEYSHRRGARRWDTGASLADVLVHLELGRDERKRVVPRCLVPVRTDESTARGVTEKGGAYSTGPRMRRPRTCVSLPFMWFVSTMICRMYACTGLLQATQK